MSAAAGAVPLQRVRVGGLEIAYRLDGPADAPVVLLVHGLLTDHRVWDAVTARLSTNYRVLRYDLRGHGSSSAGPGPCSMRALGEDAVGLMDALGIARVHLVGSSLGGMLAQQVAAHHGHKLLSLTLANTAAAQPAAAAWQARIDIVRREGVAAIADGTLQRWFTAAFAARAPDEVARMRAILCETSAAGYVGCAEAVRDLAQLDLLAQIRVPTLVVAGSHDEATPPALSVQLCAGIAGARLVSLEAAHQSALEQPEAFCAAWLDFTAA
ncbi:MAG: 3-oxoadipate enol-lactonase [Ramlibacter sp.]|nr:3-oxoadipate enol-lactonase [Ramlibacter sp.]